MYIDNNMLHLRDVLTKMSVGTSIVGNLPIANFGQPLPGPFWSVSSLPVGIEGAVYLRTKHDSLQLVLQYQPCVDLNYPLTENRSFYESVLGITADCPEVKVEVVLPDTPLDISEADIDTSNDDLSKFEAVLLEHLDDKLFILLDIPTAGRTVEEAISLLLKEASSFDDTIQELGG